VLAAFLMLRWRQLLKLLNVLMVSLALVVQPFVVHAETGIETAREIVNQSLHAQPSEASNLTQRFIEQTLGSHDEVLFVKAKELAAEARRASLESISTSGRQSAAVERMAQSGRVYVFVSSSMPRGQFVSLFKSLQGTDLDVEVVYRGLLPGNRTLVDFSREVKTFVRTIEPEFSVPISLNPTVFREAEVGVVPALAVVDGMGRYVVREGEINVRSFLDDISRGVTERKRLGAVADVAERDLTEEIRERLLAIDWDSKIKAAKSRYWVRQGLGSLPVASKTEAFDIDMSVVVNDDVQAEIDGQTVVIARKGSVFNPLDQPAFRTFNRSLLVFDPNDPRQIEWAKAKVTEALTLNRAPMLLISDVLEGRGWDSFQELEQAFGSRVFVLLPQIVSRFHLDSVPVLINPSVIPGSMRVSYFNCVGGSSCDL
jgi:conjugal transfer pilus assembly protein TraW